MNILLFTHLSDIDGMGNAVLAKLAFDKVDYVLCETFSLTKEVSKYYDDGRIYDYDRVYITDLWLEDPMYTKILNDEKLKGKFFVFDHHKTFLEKGYKQYPFAMIKIAYDDGSLCCGTSLYYDHLVSEGFIDGNNECIKTFVELTRRHDTWEWKNIYNDERARDLTLLFETLGSDGYIEKMAEKLSSNITFEFDSVESVLIKSKKDKVREKNEFYSKKIRYIDIDGLKAGVVFIAYEYRNEVAEYFRENNYDMDFAMLICLDNWTIAYRSIKDNVVVRKVAEKFGGKGHDKAGANPLTEKQLDKIIEYLSSEDTYSK